MPSEDPVGVFKTHAGYVHALAYLCGYTHFNRDPAVITALAAKIQSDSAYAATAPRATFDSQQVRRSLNAAWGSELLLALAGAYAPEDLRGVSNTWVAIQAYYACYHATQALVAAKGQARPTSHPKTQKMFTDLWVSRRMSVVPWCLAASHGCYENLPGGHVVDETVHQWAALDATSAIDLACKAFRTTRDDFVIQAKKDERAAKPPSAGVRAKPG